MMETTSPAPENGRKQERRPKSASSAAGPTPLMQQYQEIKTRYPGMILFFRLGDFYEMFGEDAQKASRILEVVLTRRQETPMCGVPHHAINAYLKKLIKAGEKVAVCEQLEDPAQARGIVKRDVVRVITPGTILEENLLEAKQNNYLLALCPAADAAVFGLAYVDISTGEFGATEVRRESLRTELFRLSPGEIIVPQNVRHNEFFTTLEQQTGIAVSGLDAWCFSPAHAQEKITAVFKVQALKPFGLENRVLAAGAAGAVLAYLDKTQVGQMPPLAGIRYYSLEDYLLLDETVVRNLELVEGSASRSRENSLLEIIDETRTPMGGRLLRRRLLQPVLSVPVIVSRQQAVGHLVEEGMARRELKELLKSIADLERILSRLASGAAGPRELVSLRHSLEAVPAVRQTLSAGDALGALPAEISAVLEGLAVPREAVELIAAAIADEPPVTLKEGGIIREGYHPGLDELRTISREGKTFISRIESEERQKTGIGSLKIGYTSVFGYYIEVTKANLGLVPPHYIRKQTVASGERFITPELKALEEKILSAQERILRLEEQIFKEVREKVLAFSRELQAVSASLARLDVYVSLAETAVNRRFSQPRVDDGYELDIRDGRHPVIESRIKSGTFVPNDTYFNGASDRIILLTGPNMAGKSTYLRQTALIVILAQMGSWVPAAEARIGIIDRIFTRIGAADNLAQGESTFMVEMHETANILHQYTDRSLIILDEVGRGTSTYDGISIARSTVEYLARDRRAGRGPKVLFATHYFELTDLPETLPGIRNCNVAVKEWQGEVVFLHKIVPGAADRSYGIHVAQLAGLPNEVIERSRAILAELERKTISGASTEQPRARQLDFLSFPSPKFLLQLRQLDLNRTTPMEALKLLAEWKSTLENDAPAEQ